MVLKDKFLVLYRTSCYRELSVRGTQGGWDFLGFRFTRNFQDWEVVELQRLLYFTSNVNQLANPIL